MARFGIHKKPFDFLKEIALRNKTIRKQAGFSQSELAKRSGVSLGSLKRFETTGQISLESLLKLVEILNRLEDFDLILKPRLIKFSGNYPAAFGNGKATKSAIAFKTGFLFLTAEPITERIMANS